MTISVRWDDDRHKTILVTYEGAWTWSDFAVAKTQIETLLVSVQHVVNIISDSRQSHTMPEGNALSRLVNSFQYAPHNIGVTAVLGASPFFRSMLHLLQTVSTSHAAQTLRFVNSEEDAYLITQTT